MAELLHNGPYHEWLRQLSLYQDQIRFSSFFPARHLEATPHYQGCYHAILSKLDLTPYSHQLAVFEQLEQEHNVVIATATASGKSLCYQVPTMFALNQQQTALYLFPTKALAHDQLQKLQAIAKQLGETQLISTYDGDTPTSARPAIRAQAGCLLTNPDMMHYGMLAHHGQWARFLSSLAVIVVDELHSYRGVMGSHVANILRRLIRMARHYGAEPQIIAASATIANPAEHATNLTGEDFVAVAQDGSASPAKELIFWCPPTVQNDAEKRRRSSNIEAADLAVQFVRQGLKSIFFCNSRRSAELLKRYAVGHLDDDQLARLQTYRAGYTASDRRALEQGFKDGEITVLTATSALELGVDVGGVDAVVLVGYPGSLSSFWQRAGRAGRGSKRALTLLIPGNDPLDEYHLNHPELITEGRLEHAVADAFNEELHPLHLVCAAYEKPLRFEEALIGDGIVLDRVPQLYQRGERWVHYGAYPHRRIDVRGMGGGKRVRLKTNEGHSMGISDYAAALRELHPGAVYLYQGETYLVRNLDLDKGQAVLLPHIEDYYTQARSETDIEILTEEAKLYGVSVGRVRVNYAVTGYVRKRYRSEVIVDERPLDLPDLAYNTQALWFDVTEVADVLPAGLLPSAMHALEHTLIGLLPVFVLCERADVGGVSYPQYPATGAPLIFIYDGYPGGVGYARAGASVFAEWLTAAQSLLQDCPCSSGCPRCVLSPKCGNGNQYLDKAAALTLAEALLVKLESMRQLNLKKQLVVMPSSVINCIMLIYRLAGSLERLERETSLLWDLGCQGILEEDASIVAYFDAPLEIPLSGKWEEVEDKDWLEAYYAELQPVVLERLIVAPRHCSVTPENAQQVLWLDPGMAFGTGHHATTLMALRSLESLELAAKDVLDIGSGSGILAIAADLLGARSSLGIDIDPTTLPIAQANAQNNHSSASFSLTDSTTLASASADVIIANLYAELHSQLMRDYQRLLKPGGRLILTGILAEREGSVSRSAGGLFDHVSRQQIDEWVLLVFKACA